MSHLSDKELTWCADSYEAIVTLHADRSILLMQEEAAPAATIIAQTEEGSAIDDDDGFATMSVTHSGLASDDDELSTFEDSSADEEGEWVCVDEEEASL